MNKLENILREFVISIIAGVLVVVLTLFFLIPKTKEIFSLRQELATQNSQISKLSQKLADLKSLSEADLQISTNLVLQALPINQDPFNVLSTAEKIFLDNGIFLDSFKFLNSAASPSGNNVEEISPLGVSFSFSTTFNDFKEMIKETENFLPIIKVEGIKFGSVEASASASMPNLSGKISFISFSAPLPKDIGKIDKEIPKISSKDKEFIDKLREYQIFQTEPSEGIDTSLPVGKENPFSF